jgi:hypothetical protein
MIIHGKSVGWFTEKATANRPTPEETEKFVRQADAAGALTRFSHEYFVPQPVSI